MALRIAWLLSTWLNAFLALSLMASSSRNRMPSADWDSVTECAVLSKSLDTEAEYCLCDDSIDFWFVLQMPNTSPVGRTFRCSLLDPFLVIISWRYHHVFQP